jgi:catechol 2,3-dioxygenase-like lactoylglutathione lyase family enzyme
VDLSRYTVRPSIAVSDIARAAEFYEGKLSLAAGEEQSDDNVEEVVDELAFKGIHVLDDGRVAWFKDPDGNTFAIEEGTAP